MANRLKKMLTEEMVRLDPPLLSTPEEVIEYCGNILVENKKAKAGYVKEMIDRFIIHLERKQQNVAKACIFNIKCQRLLTF